ncbi:riboflavin biosynthesis pyrimidine reductase [Thermocatellispora tengchongensis]|uniref:Riboflavin biosynthesis pyrimidine reductase n=1 Tax=Thermocatellispora tengchongensis TaxID=1073253 RepID=A0A840NZG0_9ACTN|nr:pyrimidine reductase family protein [Thermocatellispora tengchongensis]MBB5131041.1 riboflavin biosynthesis pyrimidine reductase [Thermocatellispora tengchongensis]
MRRIFPTQESGEVDLATAYAYPADRPWLRLNMVASADGGAWLKGLSGGLSGPADKRVFGVLRGLADVVLAGAATVRAEGYGPARPRESWRALREGRPAVPPVAVVTRGLGLDLGGPLFTEAAPGARTIVITCEAAPAGRRAQAAAVADVVVAGAERVDLALALEALRERGLTRVLCEGGPRLNGQLAAAGLVDELCLTCAPVLVGGAAARVLNGPDCEVRLGLAHILEEDGYLFARYVRESP